MTGDPAPMSLTTHSFEPFGNLAIIGEGYDLLLQRVCYCYHAASPQSVCEGHALAVVASTLEASRPTPDGKVRWWKITKRGDSSYICVQPPAPGYRVAPPTGPNIFIEELPLELGLSILSRISQTTLEKRALRRPPESAETRYMIEGLKSASTRQEARDTGGFVSRMAQYSSDIQHGRHRTPEAMQEAINEVYQKGLFEVETDCFHFSTAIALFELQAEMNMWICQPAYLKPIDYLRTIIESGHVTEQVLFKVGEYHLRAGKDSILEALSAECLWSFQKKLYLALHHYWIPHTLSRLSKAKFPYSAVVAEESLVCAQSGLACGLGTFFDRSFIDMGEDLARFINLEGDKAVESFLRDYSSAFSPVIPKPLAHLIVAFARVLAQPAGVGNERDLDPLYKAYRETRNTSHLTRSIFPSFIMDTLLLNAAKHLGLESLAQQQATRIAGQLIVDRLLH